MSPIYKRRGEAIFTRATGSAVNCVRWKNTEAENTVATNFNQRAVHHISFLSSKSSLCEQSPSFLFYRCLVSGRMLSAQEKCRGRETGVFVWITFYFVLPVFLVVDKKKTGRLAAAAAAANLKCSDDFLFTLYLKSSARTAVDLFNEFGKCADVREARIKSIRQRVLFVHSAREIVASSLCAEAIYQTVNDEVATHCTHKRKYWGKSELENVCVMRMVCAYDVTLQHRFEVWFKIRDHLSTIFVFSSAMLAQKAPKPHAICHMHT